MAKVVGVKRKRDVLKTGNAPIGHYGKRRFQPLPSEFISHATIMEFINLTRHPNVEKCLDFVTGVKLVFYFVVNLRGNRDFGCWCYERDILVYDPTGQLFF